MAKLFVSYRRNDTKWITAHLCAYLEGHFGVNSVFRDVDSVPLSVDVREHIRKVIDTCDVLIAVVGPSWFEMDSSGKSRLDDKADWVRLEIAAALAKKMPVVPLLVDGAEMPKPQQLPEELRDFAYKNAASFDLINFKSQIARLVKALDQLLPIPLPAPAYQSSRILSGAAPSTTSPVRPTAISKMQQRDNVAEEQPYRWPLRIWTAGIAIQSLALGISYFTNSELYQGFGICLFIWTCFALAIGIAIQRCWVTLGNKVRYGWIGGIATIIIVEVFIISFTNAGDLFAILFLVLLLWIIVLPLMIALAQWGLTKRRRSF